MKIITLVAIFAIVASQGTMGIISMNLMQTVHADKCVGDGCTITKINGHNSQHCQVKNGNIKNCSN
jgi:hypothetical protein